jgi:integrase
MKSILYARPRTFGFRTFRRTLASVLVRMKVDITTVQEILRHQNLKTTLEVYAKAMSEDKLEAQGMFLDRRALADSFSYADLSLIAVSQPQITSR